MSAQHVQSLVVDKRDYLIRPSREMEVLKNANNDQKLSPDSTSAISIFLNILINIVHQNCAHLALGENGKQGYLSFHEVKQISTV